MEKKTCLLCFNLVRTKNNKVKCKLAIGNLKKELPLTTLPKSFEVLADKCAGFDNEDNEE
jgi:hypothetical protein